MRIFRKLFGGDASGSTHPVPAVVATYKRTCFIPKVEDGADDESNSKFSGLACLRRNESWPECPNCNQPMQLFLQLDSGDLPRELGRPYGEGLLQFFYCTSSEPLCEVRCQAYFPFARSTLLRVIPPDDYVIPSQSPVKDAFPVKNIIGWEPADDFPNLEELGDFDIELSDDECETLMEAGFPLAGDKLSGWPAWVQGVEYPACPTCGTRMQHLFQIDSECNLPHMFGDVGCGHITQCPNHREVLAFGWACA